jgi:hypothetical protein
LSSNIQSRPSNGKFVAFFEASRLLALAAAAAASPVPALAPIALNFSIKNQLSVNGWL